MWVEFGVAIGIVLQPARIAKIHLTTQADDSAKKEKDMNELPPIQNPSKVNVAVLLFLVFIFYIILLTCLGVTAYALVKVLMFTPFYFRHFRGSGAVEIYIVILIGIVLFGLGLIGAIFAKVGTDPLGLRLSREKHAKVFGLTDEVAQAVAADPIHEIFLTPEDELGVWEEAALYLPPGTGKRKIILGMGALSYLTLQQLRSILAHEYGHFSNRDTYFARFIHRVMAGYNELITIISASRIQIVNPLFWLIRIYVDLFNSMAFSFSRRKEIVADRFAVEAYGADIFGEALIAAHVGGDIFSQIGIEGAFELAKESRGFKNIYRFVSEARDDMQQNSPNEYNAAYAETFKQCSAAPGTHPSLRDRLKAQGIDVEQVMLSNIVWPVDYEERRTKDDTGPISAAQSLFGEETLELQHKLSEMVAAKYTNLVEIIREAESGD